MALCIFSMFNISEQTLGLILCNILITERCEQRGLGNHKLLGATALIRKFKAKCSQWDLTHFILFFKDEKSNHTMIRGCNGT